MADNYRVPAPGWIIKVVMPNEQLANRILDLAEGATATERFVLKVAAGMIKMIDPDYDPKKETDERIKLTSDEFEWLPGPIEVWGGIARPKDWEIPEWIEASEQYRREIEAIMYRDGISETYAELKHQQARGLISHVTQVGPNKYIITDKPTNSE